jgi:hypothetical protein
MTQGQPRCGAKGWHSCAPASKARVRESLLDILLVVLSRHFRAGALIPRIRLRHEQSMLSE